METSTSPATPASPTPPTPEPEGYTPEFFEVALLGHRKVICEIEHYELRGFPFWRLVPSNGKPYFINPGTAVFELKPHPDPRPLGGLPEGWAAQFSRTDYEGGLVYRVTDQFGLVSSAVVESEGELRRRIAAAAERAKAGVDLSTYAGCLAAARAVYVEPGAALTDDEENDLLNRAANLARSRGIEPPREPRRKPGDRWFRVTSGHDILQVIDLPPPGGVLKIGSLAGSQIQLPEAEGVARMHAVIEHREDGQVVIVPCAGETRRGTAELPNASGPHAIIPSDIVIAGPYSIEFLMVPATGEADVTAEPEPAIDAGFVEVPDENDARLAAEVQRVAEALRNMPGQETADEAAELIELLAARAGLTDEPARDDDGIKF